MMWLYFSTSRYWKWWRGRWCCCGCY